MGQANAQTRPAAGPQAGGELPPVRSQPLLPLGGKAQHQVLGHQEPHMPGIHLRGPEIRRHPSLQSGQRPQRRKVHVRKRGQERVGAALGGRHRILPWGPPLPHCRPQLQQGLRSLPLSLVQLLKRQPLETHRHAPEGKVIRNY